MKVQGLATISFSFAALLFSLGCGTGSTVPPPFITLNPTANPLVARYSVISRCSGTAMVDFGADQSYGRSTSWQAVSSEHTTDILVAGMKASSTYHMRSTVRCGDASAQSDDSTFTTGPLPSTTFPTLTVTRPPAPFGRHGKRRHRTGEHIRSRGQRHPGPLHRSRCQSHLVLRRRRSRWKRALHDEADA